MLSHHKMQNQMLKPHLIIVIYFVKYPNVKFAFIMNKHFNIEHFYFLHHTTHANNN